MEKITVASLLQAKSRAEKIIMLTAYDYPSSVILDRTGVDIILVGDSLSMVVLGYDSTLPVTMDEMIHHTKAVTRGAQRALVVGDMPFMSYQAGISDAVSNAGRFIKEAGASAVKLEGGRRIIPTIKAILDAQIPVMGHLGLTPQSIHRFGGYRVQGKTAQAAQELLEDALALQEAGVFAIVLEGIPAELSPYISSRLSIPTIGIGAGAGCDGQVLVFHDFIGYTDAKLPKFVKKYLDLNETIRKATDEFIDDVKNLRYPADEHTYKLPRQELEILRDMGWKI